MGAQRADGDVLDVHCVVRVSVQGWPGHPGTRSISWVHSDRVVCRSTPGDGRPVRRGGDRVRRQPAEGLRDWRLHVVIDLHQLAVARLRDHAGLRAGRVDGAREHVGLRVRRN